MFKWLKDKVNKMKLYEYLLFSDNYDTPENHENLINSFVIYWVQFFKNSYVFAEYMDLDNYNTY